MLSFPFTAVAASTVNPALLLPAKCRAQRHRFNPSACTFPSFLPKEVENIKDSFARKLATRIQRLPVRVTLFPSSSLFSSLFSSFSCCSQSALNRQLSFSDSSIMSSCVRPTVQSKTSPVVLLHGFDSSCLEWRYTLPLLEEAGLETWALDILGWGFNDLERFPPCDVASKRDHLYQFWKSYIHRPIILVGPSLGAAAAVDFAVTHPDAIEKLVLIDASVYAEGTGNMAKLPRAVAYAGVYLLKSLPLRLYVNVQAFNGLPLNTSIDWMNVGRLHCRYPWWEDATVNFMISGGYDVRAQIKKVQQRTLIIWGEDDQIISSKMALRLHSELPNAIIRQIPDCGHLPHVERPKITAKLIVEFAEEDSFKEAQFVSQV